jgi:CheY-like chemotaxis protein
VLVCDADPQVGASIGQMLRHEGFDVRAVYSACRLLAHIDQGWGDLVLTDVLMPDMDATELLDALTTRPDRTYRLVLHSYAGDAAELRRRGVDVFLRRPALRPELVQAVQIAMGNPAVRRRQALLIESDEFTLEGFSGPLSDAGYMPIVVDGLRRAADVLGESAVDALIVPAALLGEQWEKLEALRDLLKEHGQLIVLCPRIARTERRLASDRGVDACSYRPGQERNIVESMLSQPDPAMEIADETNPPVR